MSTLKNLIEAYGANGFVVEDAGNGAAEPKWGTFARVDGSYGDALLKMYGDTEMYKLDEPHISADGVVCEFGSDWIISSDTNGFVGDNPYRERLFF